MNYQTKTLESGLRIIHLPSDSTVIYCGIGVKAGTRNELKGEEGLAHFCEHLSFKGTRQRTAVQIINAIEGVGGELNAFTNKEDTMYYCAIQRSHFMKAVDVLCDIVFDSQFPQAEVEKEREVVCEEIESYEDSPAELIYDEFENLLFAGHPLGHNILGTREQVRAYSSADARRFTARNYRPDNAIFFVSGNIDFEKLVKKLEKASPSCVPSVASEQCSSAAPEGAIIDTSFHSETIEAPSGAVGGASGAFIVRQRGTHQAHVMMGGLGFPATDPQRWSLYLLNNILGGPGMNSRLNLALRERYGLVYTVESSMVSYSDAGLWSVYFGCDPDDVKRCCRLVRSELNRLMRSPLSVRQLSAMKRQLQGQLAIAADSREQFAIDFAKNFLHSGKLRDLNDIMRHIDRLTPDDLHETANALFNEERICTLIYE